MIEKMHLSFLFVKEYSVLKNVGLSFDHRFVFYVNGDTLHIRRNEGFPVNFLENGIYSLTAIVGKNGSGKTTAMRLMKRLFVEGSPREEEVEVLIAYEMEGDLCIYNHTGLTITAEDGVVVNHIETRSTIETLYYSGHFQPYTGAEGEMELSGSYEASDAWLLVKDLQDYANVDTFHLSEPLYNHLAAYYAQNHYRICELLSLDGLEELLMSVRLPKYIQFAPNRGGWNALKLNRYGALDDLEIPGEHWTSRNIKERALEIIVYYGIINLIAERKGEIKVLHAILKEWVQMPKEGGVENALERIIEERKLDDDTHAGIKALHYVIDRLVAICEFDELSGSYFITIRGGKDRLQLLMDEVFRSRYFLTARFLDIVYTNQPGIDTKLSSGEQELLNLLSRLYYGITLAPQKFGNLNSPRLLMLDEAEIGFHPEWQQQYVQILTEFISFMKVVGGVDFQIVLTSHSPIILSDIPVNCVNFLSREGDTTCVVTDEKQTFGENVFNLYRRAFFMENGLVGAFASSKLRNLFDRARRGENDEELMKEVELIGDERIKDALLYEIGNHHYEVARNYYQRKLEELNRRRADEEDRPE